MAQLLTAGEIRIHYDPGERLASGKSERGFMDFGIELWESCKLAINEVVIAFFLFFFGPDKGVADPVVDVDGLVIADA